MGVTFLCQGCGTRTAVPDDYARKKMQCPACGVMCEVPAMDPKEGTARRRSRRNAEPPSLPKEPVESKGQGPPPAKGPMPPAVTPSTKPPKPEPAVVPCPQCRQPVQVPTNLGGRQLRCPRCGVVVAEPAAWEVAGGSVARAPMPPAGHSGGASADEEEGAPYAVTVAEGRLCPECSHSLAAEARVCDQCGFDLDTGRKPAPKVYEPLACHWEAGLPFARRLRLFVILEALLIGVAGLGAALAAAPGAFLGSGLVISIMLLFLLGTYDRIDLDRDRRGRVRLARTWRVCFYLAGTQAIDWRDCDAIVTGTTLEVDVWDWLVAGSLFVFLVIPGVVWWYLMHKVSYFVALTKDHGYPAVMLYKGWAEDHMEDIARTVHEATGLPYDNQ